MNTLVNGALLGLAYSLIAVGMALILGVAKIFDLVYASYYTLAAYVAVMLIRWMGPNFPIWLSFIIAGTVAVAFSLATHKFLILPIRKQGTAVMVLTLAVAMVIQELLIFKEGSEPIYLPPMLKGAISILGVWVPSQKFLVAGISIGIMGSLWLFLSKTKLGLAIRVTAEQPEAMQLAGGNIQRICLSAALLGGMVAAIGGLFLAPIFPPHPYAWLDLLIIAFAVIVLGGLGNIWGCLPAGLILGISEVAVAINIPFGGIIKRSVGLLIIMLVLLFRPMGLLGVQGWEEEA
jgi:branched-subunit amino acid ABC-type transport system permease component